MSNQVGTGGEKCQQGMNENERKSVKDSGETSDVVWLRDSGNNKETGGMDGDSRGEDVEVLFWE